MARDNLLAARRAALQMLKADAPLLALVPAASMYPQHVPVPEPAWPFVKTGAFSALPVRAACVDGSSIIGAVHAFARERLVNGVVVETAEDHASRIGTTIARALSGQKVAIESGSLLFTWTGSQLLDDGDGFHAVTNFRIRAITA